MRQMADHNHSVARPRLLALKDDPVSTLPRTERASSTLLDGHPDRQEEFRERVRLGAEATLASFVKHNLWPYEAPYILTFLSTPGKAGAAARQIMLVVPAVFEIPDRYNAQIIEAIGRTFNNENDKLFRDCLSHASAKQDLFYWIKQLGFEDPELTDEWIQLALHTNEHSRAAVTKLREGVVRKVDRNAWSQIDWKVYHYPAHFPKMHKKFQLAFDTQPSSDFGEEQLFSELKQDDRANWSDVRFDACIKWKNNIASRLLERVKRIHGRGLDPYHSHGRVAMLLMLHAEQISVSYSEEHMKDAPSPKEMRKKTAARRTDMTRAHVQLAEATAYTTRNRRDIPQKEDLEAKAAEIRLTFQPDSMQPTLGIDTSLRRLNLSFDKVPARPPGTLENEFARFAPLFIAMLKWWSGQLEPPTHRLLHVLLVMLPRGMRAKLGTGASFVDGSGALLKGKTMGAWRIFKANAGGDVTLAALALSPYLLSARQQNWSGAPQETPPPAATSPALRWANAERTPVSRTRPLLKTPPANIGVFQSTLREFSATQSAGSRDAARAAAFGDPSPALAPVEPAP